MRRSQSEMGVHGQTGTGNMKRSQSHIDRKFSQPQNEADRKSHDRKVLCQIQPEWAQNAVSMTSASVEISFDQLRSIYQDLTERDRDAADAAPNTVTITLLPKHLKSGMVPHSPAFKKLI